MHTSLAATLLVFFIAVPARSAAQQQDPIARDLRIGMSLAASLATRFASDAQIELEGAQRVAASRLSAACIAPVGGQRDVMTPAPCSRPNAVPWTHAKGAAKLIVTGYATIAGGERRFDLSYRHDRLDLVVLHLPGDLEHAKATAAQLSGRYRLAEPRAEDVKRFQARQARCLAWVDRAARVMLVMWAGKDTGLIYADDNAMSLLTGSLEDCLPR